MNNTTLIMVAAYVAVSGVKSLMDTAVTAIVTDAVKNAMKKK